MRSASSPLKFSTSAKIRLCFAVLLLANVAFSAISLEEYQAKLHKLKSELILSDEKDSTLFDRARKDFPNRVTIESGNSRFEISNEWLLSKLEKIQNSSGEERKSNVDETLKTIEYALKEVEKLKQTKTASLSKSEAKKKLEQILSKPEYLKPEEKEPNAFEKFIENILRWLQRNSPKPVIPEASSETQKILSLVLQIIITVLLCVLIGILFYRLTLRSTSNNTLSEEDETIVLGEKLSKTNSSEDLLSEAKRLVEEGNMRLAIRKAYIALLYELANRKILRLSKNKTNRDYLEEVKHNLEIYPSFCSMTKSFERAWYGFRNLTRSDWENFMATYKQTINKRVGKG
ncbi:MAG: DUF4129 domain-containing protein [Pyrinomonadaceae bacterium]|nr:DUF4129 domain-containing protein [Pyrinomonadaceae bacterium]